MLNLVDVRSACLDLLFDWLIVEAVSTQHSICTAIGSISQCNVLILQFAIAFVRNNVPLDPVEWLILFDATLILHSVMETLQYFFPWG